MGKEKAGGDYGKMSTRAWIWQERLLAARTVFVTPTALKFECRCYSKWEGFDEGRKGHSWSAKLDTMTHQTWVTLVEDYMRRQITRPYDRLPAMDSVMKRIEKNTGWSPFWGLWSSELIEGLCWSASSSDEHGQHTCQMNPAHYAPTWSWASVDGPISYSSVKPAALLASDPLQPDLECRSLNSASGRVTLSGRVIFLNLFGKVEREPEHGGHPGRLEYTYTVGGTPAGERGFPVHADVPLKRWVWVVGDVQETTVIRVPSGESAPTESWSAVCACLLVSSRRLLCCVLILGRSLRELHAWERVGIVDGIDPSAFSQAKRERIDIV